MHKKTLLFWLFCFKIGFTFSQNVGIGITNPIHARLELNGSIGDAAAIFGADKYGTTIKADFPGIGFNFFYNNGSKTIKAGYAGLMEMNPSTGNIYVGGFNGNQSFTNFGDIIGYRQILTLQQDGHVGINTMTPLASLQVADSSVLFNASGDVSAFPSDPPLSGEGRRMMWYSDKAAFRVGYVSLNQWNSNNIGYYSVAMGLNPLASGMASVAFGEKSTANGNNSLAIGKLVTASGANSTALGTLVSTNGQSGSFAIGDLGDGDITHVFNNDAPNQMMMRFIGGYKFYTVGWGFNIGAQLVAGSTSWNVMSDFNKKEKFIPVNGEEVLEKIKGFTLTSWNYKGADSKTMRHYGPMAQDFYTAFGKDAIGKIGCDSLIDEHDFSSINFIAIQALEKRSQKITEQQQQINELREYIETLKNEMAELRKLIQSQKAATDK